MQLEIKDSDLLSRFKVNNIVQIFFLVVSKISTFLFLGYALRFVGVEPFGRYSFVISFISLFLIFTDLGINTLGTREIAADPAIINKLFNTKLVSTFWSSVVVVILLNIFFVIFSHDKSLISLVAIASISLICNSITSSYSMVLSGVQRLDLASAAENGGNLLLYVVSIATLYFYPDLKVLVFLYTLFSFLKIFLLKRFVKNIVKIDLSFDWDYFKDLMKQAFPILLIAIFYRLYFSVDNSILWFLKGDLAVGKYAPLMRILELLQALPILIMASLFPVISKLINQYDKLNFIYQRVNKYFFLIAAPITVFFLIRADFILPLLYGNKQVDQEIVTAFKIIIWTCSFLYANQFFGNFLIANRCQGYIPWVVSGCCILNVIGNIVLIPHYNILGASIMTLATEIVQFTALYFICSTKLKFSIEKKWQFFLAAFYILILYFINVRLLSGLSVYISLAVSAVIYLFMITAFFVIDKRDRTLILEISKLRKKYK